MISFLVHLVFISYSLFLLLHCMCGYGIVFNNISNAEPHCISRDPHVNWPAALPVNEQIKQNTSSNIEPPLFTLWTATRVLRTREKSLVDGGSIGGRILILHAFKSIANTACAEHVYLLCMAKIAKRMLLFSWIVKDGLKWFNQFLQFFFFHLSWFLLFTFRCMPGRLACIAVSASGALFPWMRNKIIHLLYVKSSVSIQILWKQKKKT